MDTYLYMSRWPKNYPISRKREWNDCFIKNTHKISMIDSFRIKYENMNKPNETLETSTLMPHVYHNFFLFLQRQINGPIDEYSFQEKAPNSYDLRDH